MKREGPSETFFEDGLAGRAFLEQWGITRVGDLTGLDVIGIPVWFACRPNSRSLSVAQGKGLTDAQARVSAVMEAVEGAVAEQTTPLISKVCSARELRAAGGEIVPVDQLQRCNSDRIDPDQVRSWVKGRRLVAETPIYAPYELVGLDMRAEQGWDHTAFRMSTIGLGAGRNVPQAVAHALCEIIENDATSLVEFFGVTSVLQHAIGCDDTENSALGEAIDIVRRSGFVPKFFHIPGTIPVPTIGCFLEAESPRFKLGNVHLTAGFACRARASDAALAALLEAVQSRLTTIAAAREDLRAAAFGAGFKPLPETPAPTTDIDALSPHQHGVGTDASALLDFLVRSVLEHSNATDVFVFQLTDPEWPFQVVRVLVPNLECVVGSGTGRLGEHGFKRMVKAGEGA